MLLNHVGVVNQNEEQAVKFYGDFLGLANTRSFLIPPDLSAQLFSVKREIKVMVFEKDGIKIEVFLSPEFKPASPDLGHIGFLLSDFDSALEKARSAGIEIIFGASGEKTVYFVKDFSGNLIEIKPR